MGISFQVGEPRRVCRGREGSEGEEDVNIYL